MTTACACRRPGARPRRSIGPLTDTAGDDATAEPHRRRHRRDADLALAHALRPAAPRTPASVVAVNFAPMSPRCIARAPPRRAAPAPPTRVHRQHGAGDRVAQAGQPLGGGHAQMRWSPGGGRLAALAGGVAQRVSTGLPRRAAGPRPRRSRARPGAGRARTGPAGSRATKRWCSRAVASRCAVGQATRSPARDRPG